VIAPLISGAIAAAYGIRPIYFVGAALFILMIPLIIWTSRKTRAPH
jgi:DMSO/TMAO reductase YedYZ heme-binding membrane subunit